MKIIHNIFMAILIGLTSISIVAMEQQLSTLDRQLILAAEHGNVEKIAELLNAGAHVNPIVAQVSPLGAAIRNNQLPAVKLLIEKKADLNVRESAQGVTPVIMSAQQSNKLPILFELLNHGAKVNLQDNTGYTALHYAAGYDQLGAIIALLAANANPLIRTNADKYAVVKNATPLEIAKKAGFKNAQVILENIALSPEEIKYITTGILSAKAQMNAMNVIIRDFNDKIFETLAHDVAEKKMANIQGKLPEAIWTALDKTLLMKALEINVKRGFGLPK